MSVLDEVSAESGAAPARAGRLACFCPPGAPSPGADLAASLDEARWSPGVATLAAGFALSVLSQSLALGVLPLAGRLLAPAPILMAAPYIAMLLGAATATFPASFLLDAFGRRAALALGASLGIAGGLVMAWALTVNLFAPFCLGAFWLGVAQGFSLFYRHEAALGAGSGGRARAALIVFGSGALAGLAGPALAFAVAIHAPASVFPATALAAALTQVLVLALAVFATARAPVTPPAAHSGRAAGLARFRRAKPDRRAGVVRHDRGHGRGARRDGRLRHWRSLGLQRHFLACRRHVCAGLFHWNFRPPHRGAGHLGRRSGADRGSLGP